MYKKFQGPNKPKNLIFQCHNHPCNISFRPLFWILKTPKRQSFRHLNKPICAIDSLCLTVTPRNEAVTPNPQTIILSPALKLSHPPKQCDTPPSHYYTLPSKCQTHLSNPALKLSHTVLALLHLALTLSYYCTVTPIPHTMTHTTVL